MEIVERLVVPEVAYALLAVLGLLAVWQYHQNQVLSGRIYSVDFWDISGIRMFMHAATWDGKACLTCQTANGTVFLPSLSTKKNFSTLDGPCSSHRGCRCLIVGLYGGWPEADRLVQSLRKTSKKKPLKLSDKEWLKLFQGPWQQGISGATDRLTIHMLEALRLEGTNCDGAVYRYRYILEQARGARDIRLLVPGYLRLADLLRRMNRPDEALATIEEFEVRFAKRKALFYYPSSAQREEMAQLKGRLLKMRTKLKPPASLQSPERPATEALIS